MSKQVTLDVNATSRARDALREAAGFRFEEKPVHCVPRDGRDSCHSFRTEYFCQGHRFRDSKALCDFMVYEINSWMGEAGLVNWSILENAHSSHGRDFLMFTIHDSEKA